MRCMRRTSLGFCLRVIVNEKTLNFEKTTYSVLSVLLLKYGSNNSFQIYCFLWIDQLFGALSYDRISPYSPNNEGWGGGKL